MVSYGQKKCNRIYRTSKSGAVDTINYLDLGGHGQAFDVSNNDEIYAIHFDTATRINQDSGSLYYLKRTKYLSVQKIKDNTTIYRYIRSRNKSFLPYIYNTALISSNKRWKKENEIFETVNQFKKINNIC